MKKQGFLLLLALTVFFFGCKDRDKVKPAADTGLAKLYIQTENDGAITKDDYIGATFDFYPANPMEGDTLRGVEGKIKGRGNSTWTMIKKPYKIKMSDKTSFFSMPPEKKWVLLANYADKTLIRNYLAYRLAEQMGSPFPPSHHFLEVYLNGEHQGNYMMSDQTEVGITRVNIPELSPSDNDPFSITGGYLMEIDQEVRDKPDEVYFEAQTFPIRMRSPEEPSPEQLDYISGYLAEAEDTLFSDGFRDPVHGFRKYFDETSMIQWFIISEVFKNVDSRDYGSIFFYKDRGSDKFVMGPIWDFDLSAGNQRECSDCLDPTGWYVRYSYWFERMYQDPAFKADVKRLWNQYKPLIDNLIPTIDMMSQQLQSSQKENFRLWPDFNDPSWAVPQGIQSYDEQIRYLKNFLQRRIAWMDQQFNS